MYCRSNGAIVAVAASPNVAPTSKWFLPSLFRTDEPRHAPAPPSDGGVDEPSMDGLLPPPSSPAPPPSDPLTPASFPAFVPALEPPPQLEAASIAKTTQTKFRPRMRGRVSPSASMRHAV